MICGYSFLDLCKPGRIRIYSFKLKADRVILCCDNHLPHIPSNWTELSVEEYLAFTVLEI